MLFSKLFPISLMIIFCIYNEVEGKSHGGGRSGGRGSSRSSGQSSRRVHHSSNGSRHSSSSRKTWSISPSVEEPISSYSSLSDSKLPAYSTPTYSPPAYSPLDYNPSPHQSPTVYAPHTISTNKLDNFLTGYFTARGLGSSISYLNNHSPNNGLNVFSKPSLYDTENSYINYRYPEPYQPPIVIPPNLWERNFEKINSNEHIKTTPNTIWEQHNSPYTTQISLISDNITTTKPTLELKEVQIPSKKGRGASLEAYNSLEIHCKQVLHSGFKDQGEIIDSVGEICSHLSPVTIPPPITSATTITETFPVPQAMISPIPYAMKKKRYEHIIVETVRGINCRKVMNSELSERGEIIDSVTEVCDPPPTTTTTTKKLTIKTTTKTPTTSSKPLIKVCRLVMDSFLNDAGEIIDSVTEVCTMEPVI